MKVTMIVKEVDELTATTEEGDRTVYTYKAENATGATISLKSTDAGLLSIGDEVTLMTSMTQKKLKN